MTKPLYCLKYSAMNDPALSADDVLVAFVDLQAGIVNLGITNTPARLRTAVSALADLAAAFSLPVVISCVPTTSAAVAPLLPEIAQRLPDAKPLVRSTANAMDDEPFCAALAAFGRKTLIVAGVATEVAVRLMALSAARQGFRAIVAVDACGGLNERTESAALMHLAGAGIELSAVATIAAQLAGDFNSELGRAAMLALQSTLPAHAGAHEPAAGRA
jgi:nicotinamidase-related amidase